MPILNVMFAGDVLANCLNSVVNDILSSGKIPDVFKQGGITPVYKKPGKPINDPNFYRRITITSIVGKLVEKVHLDTVTEMLSKVQNKLHRGFTKDTSPSFGSLTQTDAIAEPIDVGKSHIPPSLMPTRHSTSFGMTQFLSSCTMLVYKDTNGSS